MTMCWGGSGRSSSISMVGRKSSATVQQMQPLASSTTSSSSQPSMPQPLSTSASMPRSPNSLITNAMRMPVGGTEQMANEGGLAGSQEIR